MIPVPDAEPGTPYGARSTLWSCHRNSAGQGIHTGRDFPAPPGTKVFAARPGVAVYADHGWFFGFHQLEIRCSDGTRDFYAHMTSRTVSNGSHVDAGQHVGFVGAEGHVTGPHLHFERHSVATGIWSCDIVRDPAPSVNYQEDDMPLNKEDLDKIRGIVDNAVGKAFRQPINELPGDKGEEMFQNKSVGDVLKGIYRNLVGKSGK